MTLRFCSETRYGIQEALLHQPTNGFRPPLFRDVLTVTVSLYPSLYTLQMVRISGEKWEDVGHCHHDVACSHRVTSLERVQESMLMELVPATLFRY